MLACWLASIGIFLSEATISVKLCAVLSQIISRESYCAYRAAIGVVVPAGKHDLKDSLGCAAWLLQASAALQVRKELVVINCAD
jgi:hypothetical protein